MLVSLVLAAVTSLAPGKYLYSVTAASGAQFGDDVSVYGTSQGFVTHEERKSSEMIATTDQHFDQSFWPNWYLGETERGEPLFIRVAFPLRWHSSARIYAGAKTTDLAIDPATCVLILDAGLTSRIVLPALVHATGDTHCTFLRADGTTIRGTFDTTTPQAQPKDAKATDAALTVKIGRATERIWYDSQTMVPDFIDLGPNGSATLMAWTREQ